MSVLLKKPPFEGVSQKELAGQIEAKKKASEKLPLWFSASNIYYPNKLNIEQTSSEETARYKAQLVEGNTLLDLTGGFGVDSYFFAEKVGSVLHCEINSELSDIAQHNFKVLGQNNIECRPEDGLSFLKNSNQKFDWIYLDPSRRNSKKEKVFLLNDCLPNVPENLSLLFKRTIHILVKTSPLLDLKKGGEELEYVKEIHVVAVNNEVKELLFILEYGYKEKVMVKTVNLKSSQKELFSFALEEESEITMDYYEPTTYLYEPNAAILKSGGFKSLAKAYGLKKLHPHSHLYSSDDLVDFPGRRFQIEQKLAYSKKSIKTLNVSKANITTRNFPISVAELRKKHKIKDGGNTYLFFTKSSKDELLVLQCEKIKD
uniref:class I SAM-dependent methyltransferase n=1 Tax=Flagellimonas crocea TaxID=3067311 RepID=UPI00296FD2DE|nr:class I SAM-dependent methyltransferase [Muricauda sp. DH64]